MKSVLMSIQPKWCELIASGKKTVEVRKTKPKLETPFKVYIYMTKSYDTLFGYGKPKKLCVDGGKVIGEFVCERIDEYRYGVFEGEFCYHIPTVEGEKTCLEYPKAEEYGNGKPLYFWHISDLVIYDKPKELSEFTKPCIYGEESDVSCFLCEKSGYRPDMHIDCFNTVTRPPQSWCYVEYPSQAERGK